MSSNSPFLAANRPIGKRKRTRSSYRNDEDCYVDEYLVEKLERNRNLVMHVINKAEEKQFTEPDIRVWLVSIKHTVYDANALLDKIDTESRFREKYKEDGSLDKGFVHRATSEIKKKIKKLKDMVKEAGVMGLKARDEGAAASAWKTQVRNDRVTSSVLSKSTIVYGREKEKEQILEQVLYSPEAAAPGNKPEVIAIVGMGGIGKTTLAQYVYNHADVKSCFTRSWACVSDNFDLVRVTRDILESLTVTAPGVCGLDPLQQQLEEQLRGKRFLIVLDDAWDSSKQNWEKLMAPFSTGATGSKIILTTRDTRVADVAPADHSFQLEPMSEDEAWSLFSREVFGDGELSQHPKLEAIGKEIVKKCGGLPLAIKTLSGLLRSERKEVEWERVRDSSLWQLPEGQEDIISALGLSYSYLPSHLKTCFAYCSLFPKDYRFSKRELVNLWIDEGFLQQLNDNRSIEDVGVASFEDLSLRSFFSPVLSKSTKSTIVYDREEEKARILKKVLYSPGPAAPGNKPEVIAIVGMGGIGKTTLAQYVYNHADVERCFTRSWACVSDNFDLVRVTLAILESLTGTAAGVRDLAPLQHQLEEQLTGKRFLLVLDHAWDSSKQNWEKLMAPFSTGAAGSKIILTTRDKSVARVVPADHSFRLEPMSEDEAWSLFLCEVFRYGELSQHPKLETIGKEIVKKCGGSPLAIKTLSGLLRYERKEVEWERVRASSLWKLQEDIAPALDYNFSDKDYKYLMHDLIHDLAQMVFADFHLQLNGHKAVKECKKVRHVSFYDHSECSSSSILEGPNQAGSLQTFMVQYEPEAPRWGWVDRILEGVLLQQLSLRVLCLRAARIRTLPDTISSLMLLRCLDVSYTDVEELPASLCKLYNLRRLLCESCDQIKEFHYDMADFVSLQHFTLSGRQLQEAPRNLSQLTRCEVMLEFYPPYREDDRMDQDMESVGVDVVDLALSDCNYTESGLCVVVNIDRSTFQIRFDTDGEGALIASDLQESLRPHGDVKEVRIGKFNGTEFPGWLVDRSYCNIEKVELVECWISSGLMPALGGPPSLKHLRLEDVRNVKKLGSELYNSTVPFGSLLEELYFGGMYEWEEWEPSDDAAAGGGICFFPRLQKLSIKSCPKLKGRLPSNLPSLEELHFEGMREWEEWEPSDDAAAAGGGICFFPRLQKLSIKLCPKLKGRLPSDLPSLKMLHIDYCRSLVELNGCHRHRQVVDLKIDYCPRLANSCLVDMRLGMFPYLQSLIIGDCDSFESFPAEDSLPTSLTYPAEEV